MRLTRFWFLLPASIAFFLICCLVDLVLLTIDGDHSLPVEVQLTGTTAESVSAIDVYRISPSGTPGQLTLKRPGLANQLLVRNEVDYLYYKGLQITIPDTVLPALQGLSVRVGDRFFAYSPDQLARSWRVTERIGGSVTYAFPAEAVGVSSHIPTFRNVFNWAGDSELLQKILFDNLPLLLVLLAVAGLYTRRGQRFQLVLQEALLAQNSNRVVALIVIGVVLYRMPYELQPIRIGIDPSWMLGLNWARNEGLRWGQDLVFTYGPYYWLSVPNLVLRQPILLLSFALTLVVFGFSISLIVRQLLDQLRVNRLSAPVAVFLLLLLLIADYSVTDAAVVGVLLLFVRGRHNRYLAHTLPAALFLALLSLTKFSYFAVALVMMTIHSLYCLTEREVRVPLLTWLTYLAAGVLLWLAADQPLSGLVAYITRCFEIASGYSEAMATPVWNENGSSVLNAIGVLFLALAVLLLAGIGLTLILALLKSKDWLFALLLTTPILFLAFKEGYTRFDRVHFTQFFEQWLVVVIALYLIRYPRSMQTFMRWFTGISLLVALVVISPKFPAYGSELAAVFSPVQRLGKLEEARQTLRAGYDLDEQLVNSLTGDTTTDIFPWDISLLYAYKLQWHPRPIIQSYSAYTAKLDSLNASYFYRKDAPGQILYSLKSIDGRYPLFDEPLVLPALMRNYNVVSQHGDRHLLLRKREKISAIESHRQIASQAVSLGRNIAIPRLTNHLIFADFQVELTVLGRLLNFLYKIPPLTINFTLDNDSRRYQARFIRRTATDGLLVSTYVDDIKSLRTLLEGRGQPNVKTVGLSGNNWFYRSTVTVLFSGQPTRQFVSEPQFVRQTAIDRQPLENHSAL